MGGGAASATATKILTYCGGLPSRARKTAALDAASETVHIASEKRTSAAVPTIHARMKAKAPAAPVPIAKLIIFIQPTSESHFPGRDSGTNSVNSHLLSSLFGEAIILGV